MARVRRDESPWAITPATKMIKVNSAATVLFTIVQAVFISTHSSKNKGKLLLRLMQNPEALLPNVGQLSSETSENGCGDPVPIGLRTQRSRQARGRARNHLCATET